MYCRFNGFAGLSQKIDIQAFKVAFPTPPLHQSVQSFFPVLQQDYKPNYANLLNHHLL
jgi:hypothetical protein